MSAEAGGTFERMLVFDIDHPDISLVLRKQAGGGQTDAVCASSHDCCLAGKIELHCSMVDASVALLYSEKRARPWAWLYRFYELSR